MLVLQVKYRTLFFVTMSSMTLFFAALYIGSTYAARSDNGGHFFKHRKIAVLAQAEQSTAWPIVVLGDSIVERASLDRVCGQPTLNAGIGYARISTVQDVTTDLLKATKVGHAVLAVGINDVLKHTSDDSLVEFEKRYEMVAEMLRDRNVRTTVALITPVSTEWMNAPGQLQKFDDINLRIAAYNNAIKRVAAKLNLKPFDFALVRENGAPIMAHASIDGVHLSTAGYETWRHSLQDAICVSHTADSRSVR
jgi:lysophospholipase L1-like esterase